MRLQTVAITGFSPFFHVVAFSCVKCCKMVFFLVKYVLNLSSDSRWGFPHGLIPSIPTVICLHLRNTVQSYLRTEKDRKMMLLSNSPRRSCCTTPKVFLLTPRSKNQPRRSPQKNPTVIFSTPTVFFFPEGQSVNPDGQIT